MKICGIETPEFLLLAAALLLVPRVSFAQAAPADLPRVALPDSPALIYSARTDDPWNRIFFFLFSRRLQVRLSNDFPEGAPYMDSGRRKVSKRLFGRDEIGDHAIDPMYPTFSVGFGSMLVLRDSAYANFTKSLQDALNDNSPRLPLVRAVMQNDLWGAYDALFVPFLPDDEKTLGQRRKLALELLGRLIRKIALTSDEIRLMPKNYPAAVQRQSFPDVFSKNSGWLEMQWFMPRLHDYQAGYRRVSRVFLKPVYAPPNMTKFLNSVADHPENPVDLEGVALITQLILINSDGKLESTRLTIEAQVRLFHQNKRSAQRAILKACEISRRLLVQAPASGGLITEDESSPAYLSDGGSYGFAEGQWTPGERPEIGAPVQVALRSRCAACHGDNLQQVMTFSFERLPHDPLPPIKILNSAENQVADFDISAKRRQADFNALLQSFR